MTSPNSQLPRLSDCVECGALSQVEYWQCPENPHGLCVRECPEIPQLNQGLLNAKSRARLTVPCKRRNMECKPGAGMIRGMNARRALSACPEIPQKPGSFCKLLKHGQAFFSVRQPASSPAPRQSNCSAFITRTGYPVSASSSASVRAAFRLTPSVLQRRRN